MCVSFVRNEKNLVVLGKKEFFNDIIRIIIRNSFISLENEKKLCYLIENMNSIASVIIKSSNIVVFKLNMINITIEDKILYDNLNNLFEKLLKESIGSLVIY